MGDVRQPGQTARRIALAALPEYAELLDEGQQGLYEYVVNGNGTAQETLDTLAATWVDSLKAAGYPAE